MNLVIVAHNIRSAENIGSLFRTADALGISRIILAGYSPDSNHSKVKKTALGAEVAVASQKYADIKVAIADLRTKGYQIIGLEIDPQSISLQDFQPESDKIALLLGNEVDGIPSYLRDVCDKLIYIPMHGAKESLNVTISAAIASWHLIQNSKTKSQNQCGLRH
ncbi:MAG: TrmH family RNA methyltransferase [Patescibacteria group bacterium]